MTPGGCKIMSQKDQFTRAAFGYDWRFPDLKVPQGIWSDDGLLDVNLGPTSGSVLVKADRPVGQHNPKRERRQ